MASLLKKTLEQLIEFWNEGVVKELTAIIPDVEWPILSNKSDLMQPEFQQACDNLFEIRRSDFVEQRIEPLIVCLLEDLSEQSKHLSRLSDVRDDLLNKREHFLEDFQDILPSPRKMKRHPKVIPGSDVARQLQLIRFEILIINDKLDVVVARISDVMNRIGSILNLAKGARESLEDVFWHRDRDDEFQKGNLERRAKRVQLVADNTYHALMIRANETREVH